VNTAHLAAKWRKSSFSGDNGGACVEVAPTRDDAVAVRHSKDPDGPVITYTRGEFRAFVAGVKAGEFDDLA
jgi:Domain of unknown function (DUF397)